MSYPWESQADYASVTVGKKDKSYVENNPMSLPIAGLIALIKCWLGIIKGF